MPAAVSCAMKPDGTRSGASVTSIAPLRGRVSVCRSSAVGARNARGSCTPGFSGDRNGPSRWMPSTLGSRSTSIATAAIAALVLSGVSLMKVGRMPVVPNFRCAAAIAVMLAGVGASLNSTSPPPLTCRSMKPGASHAPSGSVRTVMAARHLRPRHDAGDVSVLDHDSGMAMHDHAVKDVVGGNRMPGRCVHRVRVIFCKCRGRSTSVPRRSARRMSRR